MRFLRWKFLLVLICMLVVSACGGLAQKKAEQAADHMNMGIAYIESGNYPAALKELLEAEKFTPDNPKLHYYLGIAYVCNELTEKAVTEFNTAVSLKPDYSEAYNYLGTIYMSQNNWDKAIYYFSKALENVLYETPAVSLYNMARAYYSKGDYRTAVVKYQEAAIRDRNRELLPLIEIGMGKAYYDQGNLVEAGRHFKMSADLVPTFAEAHYWLAECYGKQKKLKEAKTSYETVVALAPDSELGVKARAAIKSLNP